MRSRTCALRRPLAPVPPHPNPLPRRRPLQNSRHSRGRGRFSGRNVHPASTKTPSFPQTRESSINKTPVVAADAGTQHQQKPPSFPRTRESRINKARLFTPSQPISAISVIRGSDNPPKHHLPTTASPLTHQHPVTAHQRNQRNQRFRPPLPRAHPLPPPRDLCKITVIPAKAGASADGTSIQRGGATGKRT